MSYQDVPSLHTDVPKESIQDCLDGALGSLGTIEDLVDALAHKILGIGDLKPSLTSAIVARNVASQSGDLRSKAMRIADKLSTINSRL